MRKDIRSTLFSLIIIVRRKHNFGNIDKNMGLCIYLVLNGLFAV